MGAVALVALVAALVLGSCGGGSAALEKQGQGGCAGPPPAAVNVDFEARLVALVNVRRDAAGLPPLKPVEELSSSARWFARSMATEGYFSEDHDTYVRAGGRLRRVCDWSARIGWFYPGWTAIGETIAAGPATPQQVVEGWLQSPPHRARILGVSQREAGAGYWAGGSRGHYWVLDLGRRRTAPRP
jgi:uncharacterized protein YkwD